MRRLISVVILVVCSLSHAQNFDESWRWVQFTTESGLPSNNVFDVIETPDSTLWAVCDAGVAWYDGFQWQRVQIPASHLPRINTPVCDYRNDSLLIGFDENWYAVGRYGCSKLSIQPYAGLGYLSGDTMLCIKDTSLFFLIHGVLQPSGIPEGAIRGAIERVQRMKQGRVWVTTQDGVYRWESQRWRMMFEFNGLPAVQHVIAENSAGAAFAVFALPMTLRGMWQYSPHSRGAHRITGEPEDIRAVAISPSPVWRRASSDRHIVE
jgi:hypothetical protein